MKDLRAGFFSFVYAASAVVLIARANLFGAEPEMVVGWSFPRTAPVPAPDQVEPAFVIHGLSSAGLEIQAGMSPRSMSDGHYGGAECQDATSFEDAAAASQAIAFTLETRPGHALTLSGIASFKYHRSATGATKGRWQYSVRGAQGPYVDIGHDIDWGGNDGTAASVDLSSLPSIGPGTSVTFRLVLWGASSSSGTWYIKAPAGEPPEFFSVHGTVDVVGAVIPSRPVIEPIGSASCHEGRRFECTLDIREADGDRVMTNVTTCAAIAGAYGVTPGGVFYYEPAAGDSARSPVRFTFSVSDKDGSSETTCSIEVYPGADFLETFDRASCENYARDLVSMDGDCGPWIVSNLTVKAPVASDRVVTGKSIRARGAKSCFYMDFCKTNGLSEISLYHAMADGHSSEGVSWTLSVSSDGGHSWDAYLSQPQRPAEDALVKTTFQGLGLSGNFRVRIDISAPSERVFMNFDEIAMTDYVTGNMAPAISVTPSSQTVEPGKQASIRVGTTDPEGSPVSLAVSSDDLPDASSYFSVEGGTNGLFRFIPGPGDVGRTYRLLFTATDGTDSSSLPAEITVEPLWAVDLDFSHVVHEDFDGLGTEREARLPRGWKIAMEAETNASSLFDEAMRETGKRGGTKISDRANAGAYNFGAGDGASADDRSVGFLGSGGVGAGNLMVRIRNTAAAPVKTLEVSYAIEKYRNGKNPRGFSIDLYLSGDGRRWEDLGPGFSTTFGPDGDNRGFADVPAVSKDIKGTIRRTIACGGDLYLAWRYTVSDGNETENAQALGIDDVLIRAFPERGTVLLMR